MGQAGCPPHSSDGFRMNPQLIHRLLDEAVVALLSMVAISLLPNRRPYLVFLAVFVVQILFDFVLRHLLQQI